MDRISASRAYTPAVHDWLRGFMLHVVTGIIATGAHYLLMWSLLQGGVRAVPASALGFVAGAASRFTLSYLHVFSPSIGVPAAMFRFLAALAMQFGANAVLLAGFLGAGWSVWVAQVVTTGLLTVVNYLAYRIWVFR